ncbi:hypothetical protein ACFYVL_44310 [Streptomyces sp. NPDC004111]|uniref:hypothetical protein n=1 Tax=Streptomyces sp. NPDC004111 TaxID=3364690 RepID=UPI0036BD0A18
MALRQPKPSPDDPRLSGHGRDYSASQGGHVRNDKQQPTPGAGNNSNGRLRGGR